jgi:septum formation protein
VLGAIGGDALGNSIAESLHGDGIEPLLPQDRGRKETGIALMLRDSAPNDTLLTLTDARQSLTNDDVDRTRATIERSDVLFMSGYCLTDPNRRDAAAKLMKLAREAGRLVILDAVVGMAQQIRFDELVALTFDRDRERSNVDVLVAEIPTVLEWYQAHDRPEDDWAYLREHVTPRLRARFPTIFLRTSTYSHELVISPGGVSGPFELDYPALCPGERLGYADRLTAQHVYDFLSPRLVLASGSPRRLELLRQIAANNKIVVRISDQPEPYLTNESPESRVIRLARAKARAVFEKGEFGQSIEMIIGADTDIFEIDTSGSEVPIAKPSTAQEAERALRRLGGKTHRAVTGLAVIKIDTRRRGKIVKEFADSVSTRVTFRKLTDGEIQEYVQSGEPIGKAGGYGIQGKGALLIAGIEGSYSNVVGLPLERLTDILATEFDLPIWDLDKVSGWRFPLCRGEQ